MIASVQCSNLFLITIHLLVDKKIIRILNHMAKIQIISDNPLLFPIYFHIVAIIYYICNPESVWKYRWLLSKCVVECRSLEQPNDALLCTLMMRIISTYKSASLAPNDAHHESSLKHIFNRACWFAQKFLDKFHLLAGMNP